MASSAAAYEILLDIDTDNDPTTINNFTEETSVVIKVVLIPTQPGEEIGSGGFGLGGSCLESTMDPMLLLGCADDPGFHTVLFFEPVGGGTLVLDQPIFLGQFEAGVNTVPEGCPQPASNLAAMPAQGEFRNYVQIGGPAVDAGSVSWGHIKAVYR